MSEVITAKYVLPSNPADVEKIKVAVDQMVDSLVRQAAEKEHFNDIRERLAEEFDMPKNLSAKLAKAFYLVDFDKTVAQIAEFTEVFEALK